MDAILRKERDGACGGNFGRVLAQGDGWRALDVICTAGPHDRPFEERHGWTSISLLLGGTFAYRSSQGPLLMSSGALMLGRSGESFECSHPHGVGDRCISFQFAPEQFEELVRAAGAGATFDQDRIPPLRELAAVSARATDAINNVGALEEIALELAGAVIRLEAHALVATSVRDRNRIAEVVRYLEAHSDRNDSLAELARMTQLSRYHFLRTFTNVIGITPHQWILRVRLREAARRLASTHQPITGIALDIGFEDLSNFIRSFRAEFGVSPRRYRMTRIRRTPS
ncbi:MAG TPA: AraC family transcriptional regulator [Candidatus Binataceae bacterium]|nr:AraC family transcriptional regulator [Candidatus Binataceae bacterium]